MISPDSLDPTYLDEFSDDFGDNDSPAQQALDELDARKYRGLDRDEIYKQKMHSFIRLLQDILNPAEIPEARDLDSVF